MSRSAQDHTEVSDIIDRRLSEIEDWLDGCLIALDERIKGFVTFAAALFAAGIAILTALFKKEMIGTDTRVFLILALFSSALLLIASLVLTISLKTPGPQVESIKWYVDAAKRVSPNFATNEIFDDRIQLVDSIDEAISQRARALTVLAIILVVATILLVVAAILAINELNLLFYVRKR